MHLIIVIALGIFGGLWLFTQWVEWRERRRVRAVLKEADRFLNPDLSQYQKTAPAQATKPAPMPAPSPIPEAAQSWWWVAAPLLMTAIMVLMALAVAPAAPTGPLGVNDWITKPKLPSDADVGIKPDPTATGPWTQYAAPTSGRLADGRITDFSDLIPKRQ